MLFEKLIVRIVTGMQHRTLGAPNSAGSAGLSSSEIGAIRASQLLHEAWITYCDPWMKRQFDAAGAELQPGKVYRRLGRC